MEIKKKKEEDQRHFTSECKVIHYIHQSLPHEGSSSRVPAAWPPTAWIAAAFWGEDGLTPVEISPVGNKQTNNVDILGIVF